MKVKDKVEWKSTYYDGGSLIFGIPYVNGQKHGVMKIYCEDGQLLHERPYVDGKIHGVMRHYSRDGSLESEEVWVHDFNVTKALSNKEW